jgi:hypothetical protein
MGNRAVITTREHEIGVYLHWNGGRDTVAPLLRYCELQGYRPPSADCYGWARICQVMGNFFGGSLSLGIDRFERLGDPGDNGVYVIDGWEIVGREGLYDGFVEEDGYDFNVMLHELDASMPEGERLGEYLDAAEVPASEVKLGDEVWVRTVYGLKALPVIGFHDVPAPLTRGGGRLERRPYVALYERDGDYTWNPNNFPKGDVLRVRK